MLNLDKEVLSVNPAARKMLGISSLPDIVGKRLSELDSSLAAELEPIPLYDSQTVRRTMPISINVRIHHLWTVASIIRSIWWKC